MCYLGFSIAFRESWLMWHLISYLSYFSSSNPGTICFWRKKTRWTWSERWIAGSRICHLFLSSSVIAGIFAHFPVLPMSEGQALSALFLGEGGGLLWDGEQLDLRLPPCTLQIGKNKSSADENVMTQLNVKGELFPTVHPELSCATLLFYGLLSLLVII